VAKEGSMPAEATPKEGSLSDSEGIGKVKRYKAEDYEKFLTEVRKYDGHLPVNASESFPERTFKALDTALSDAARRLGLNFERWPAVYHGKKEVWVRFVGSRTTYKRIRRTSHDKKRGSRRRLKVV
jgi:hypothetical protein